MRLILGIILLASISHAELPYQVQEVSVRDNLEYLDMKIDKAHSVANSAYSSVGSTFTILGVANGGTGAATAAGARADLNVPSNTGSGATGTWGINITGTAATATTAPNYLPLSGGTLSGQLSVNDNMTVLTSTHSQICLGGVCNTSWPTFSAGYLFELDLYGNIRPSDTAVDTDPIWELSDNNIRPEA